MSLNSQAECDALRDRFTDVAFRVVEAKIPRIEDFLIAIRASDTPVVGIVNCDCILKASASQLNWIREQSSQGLVMMERHNFSRDTLNATGISCKGYDAFLFPRDAVDRIKPINGLRIGETWWDYEFPLAFAEAQYPLAYCAPLLHLDHPLGWDREQWLKNARATWTRFGSLFDLQGSSDPQADELARFADRCFGTLQEWGVKDNSFVSKLSTGWIREIEKLRSDAETLEKLRRSDTDTLQDKISATNYKLSYAENLLFARSHPDVRRNIGQGLCTLARMLKKAHIAPWTSDLLRVKGVKLQRTADDKKMPRD